MNKYKVWDDKNKLPKQIIKAKDYNDAIDMYCLMYQISLYHHTINCKEVEKKPKKLKFKGTITFNKDVNY